MAVRCLEYKLTDRLLDLGANTVSVNIRMAVDSI